MTIACIVLAAGLSERMDGAVKQLLAFGDRTMVGRVVAVAEQTSLDPIIVVTGYEAEAVRASAASGRARFAHNPDYETGNMSSLRTGLDAAGDVAAVMLLPADQPEMDAATIETLAAAWEEWRPFAAVATYGGEIGHPWLLSAEAITEARHLVGAKALWTWLTVQRGDAVLEVEMSRPRPRDVNTPADYHAALRALGLEGEPEG
jgi:molybdenum cofactor cytidylyltransferase